MRKLQYILLTLCLCPIVVQAQRRYSTAEAWEYRLAEVSGFSKKDVDNTTDILYGLHANQYTGSHHMFGVSLEGSWSSMLTNMPKVSSLPGGGAFGFHLLYEYQYSGILLQTGLGITFQRVTNLLADTTMYHEHMHDTWSGINDVEFTLKHYFYDRRDQAQQIYVQLPLYVGHYILGSKGIGYFLVGPRLSYAVWGNTTQQLVGTTTGLYERYVGIWEEMDNHGFRKDVPIERHGDKLKLRFDVLLHGEIGYEYTSAQRPNNYRVMPSDRVDCRIRFGAFADFGILSVCPGTDNGLYGVPEETIYDFPTYRMDHAFSTVDAKKSWTRNLFLGVRVTVLFGFQGQERCILCDPWRH